MLSRSLGFILCNWICTLLANGVLRSPPQWLTTILSTLHFYYELDYFSFHTSVVLGSICFWLFSLTHWPPGSPRLSKNIFFNKGYSIVPEPFTEKVLGFPLKNLGQKSIDYIKRKSPLLIPVSLALFIYSWILLYVIVNALQSHYFWPLRWWNWTVTLWGNTGLGSWKPLVKTFHP